MSDAARKTVDRLRAAPKYRQVHIDTITDIVEREAAFAMNAADLERRARLKLHKVIADYLLQGRQSRLLRGLDDAVADGPEALREWCRGTLSRHFSTAERLPDLERLYPAILELTGPVDSIADLACALNPFTVPWLRQTSAATYTGYDLNQSYVDLGTSFLAAIDSAATVQHRDVLVRPSDITADVALLLKTYHCMEDRRAGAALRLVTDLASPFVVVSFPIRTMSGRVSPFTRAHIERLTELAAEQSWELRRATLTEEELVVLVKGPRDG